MSVVLTSRIMRTTVDIADPVLDDVRREQERQGKTLGQVVTELLAEGLAVRRAGGEPRELRWIAKNLGARIDLRDKEALWEILDAEEQASS
jgi:hypothetical protein